MKTNHAARRIVKVRLTLSLLAVIGILSVELGLGGTMARHVAQTSSAATAAQGLPASMSVGDLAALAR